MEVQRLHQFGDSRVGLTGLHRIPRSSCEKWFSSKIRATLSRLARAAEICLMTSTQYSSASTIAVNPVVTAPHGLQAD